MSTNISRFPGRTHARSLAIAACMALTFAAPVLADSGGRMMKASMDGWQEVPSASSSGSGELLIRMFGDGSGFDYTLTYRDMEGSASMSHIHLGQSGVNGGVSAFLCGGSAPACPVTAGTVEGTVTAAEVVGPAGQGIAAGEFDELVAAIRAGVTYVNVHTDKHPGGEIRGQIR